MGFAADTDFATKVCTAEVAAAPEVEEHTGLPHRAGRAIVAVVAVAGRAASDSCTATFGIGTVPEIADMQTSRSDTQQEVESAASVASLARALGRALS